MHFFQHCLHVLILCKFAGILQLQPLESLVLLWQLDFCVAVLHFCQPVHDGLGLAMDRVVQLLPVALDEGELAGLQTCLLLCLPEGCLQVILPRVHVACQEGGKVNLREGKSRSALTGKHWEAEMRVHGSWHRMKWKLEKRDCFPRSYVLIYLCLVAFRITVYPSPPETSISLSASDIFPSHSFPPLQEYPTPTKLHPGLSWGLSPSFFLHPVRAETGHLRVSILSQPCPLT